MIEVKDRVPTRPNRIRLTDESTGEIKYFVWERADEPTEVGTPINKELFDSIGSDLNGLKAVSNPNLLINGDFQVWQRSTGAFENVNGSYTADRWKTLGKSVWKGSNGRFACTEVDSGASIGNMGIIQYLDVNKNVLLGKKVTLSVNCHATSNFTAQICIGYNQVNIKHINVTTNPTVFTLTATVTEEMFAPNGGLYIQAPMKLTSDFTGATMYVVWAKLEVGDTATPFVPKSYAEELSACKYYYHKVYHRVCVPLYLTSKSGDVNTLRFYYEFPNTMRTEPTVNLLDVLLQHGVSSTAAVSTSSSDSIGRDGCGIVVTTNTVLEFSPRLWIKYEIDAEIY